MRAALLKSYGGVDQFVIDDIPMPEPGAGEVLIRIEASAVNPFDLIVRQGNMAKLMALLPITSSPEYRELQDQIRAITDY